VDLDVTGVSRMSALSATATALTTVGRIGVNTASPAVPLDVTGIMRASTLILGANTTAMSADGSSFDINNSIRALTRFTSGDNRFVICLYPRTDSNVTTIWNETETAMLFGTTSQERMRITADGKVGIGTASPTADLEVNGIAKIGNMTIGGGSIPLYPFTSHTFTNAGATGRTGPTLSTVRNHSSYASVSWAQNNSYLSMTSDNGIQLWTVPVTGTYRIRAVGAGGGGGGSGRDLQLTTTLIKGEVIRILVGQKGIITDVNGGGGGGTFVVRGIQTPIIVAGGGGGRGASGVSGMMNATLSINGNPSSSSVTKGGTNGSGGENGSDGGGGGMFGDGYGGGSAGGSADGGFAFINGGLGGRGTVGTTVHGGFGGGGGANDWDGGGGGGGYSGGGGGIGGASSYGGGGGGSFGISTLTNYGTNTHDGWVDIVLETTSVDLEQLLRQLCN
jgi:hypothetical protein